MEAMEVVTSEGARSANCGPKPEEFGLDFYQLGGDIRRLMAVPQETGSSFTALLELPANQAVELLVHSPEAVDRPPPPPPVAAAKLAVEAFNHQCLPALPQPPIFPSKAVLIDRAKFSVFASPENSPGSSSSKPPNVVKQEPMDSDSNPNSSPAVSGPTAQKPSNKRKDREKKAKESKKKNKKAANETSVEDSGGEKLPYVHVRARRGQATDSHSLAERARREKINARMKLLQELVPGCNKISGTASVLDEIINHVQSLQRQVEFLSMRLAAVNPRIDFNLDNFLPAENGSPLENNFPGMIMPPVCPEGGIRPQNQQLLHLDGFHQPILSREDNSSNFVAPEISLLSYDSSANSALLHGNQLKMEL